MTSKLSSYSNLTQRIITGLAGVILIVAATVYSAYSYFLIFFIIAFLSLREFYKLAGLDGMVPVRILGTIIGITVFGLTFFIEAGHLQSNYYFLLFPLMACVYMIKLYKRGERKPFTNIAYTFLGIFYVSLPFSLINVAVYNAGSYNYEIILGSLLILWASDTGAYFAGTYFGKRKLFERISPKKSWEGFFGGALLAFTIVFLITRYFNTLPDYKWVVIGFIIVVGGTFGDLVESLLKRSMEIKDSGSSLPGHGGFLDRFDGLLISIPFIVAFLEIVGN